MKEGMKLDKKYVYIVIVTVCLILMLLLEFMDISFFSNQLVTLMVKGSLSRILGGTAFIIILSRLGYHYFKPFRKPFLGSLLVIIPGLIVALNNFPIIAYLDSRAYITEPLYEIYYFAIESFSIGFFEEIIFRGVILVVLLQRLPKTRKGAFLAVVISSAIFGIIHLFNILAGASIGSTLLQVGYSFLMGMMWAVVFIKTKNIWMPIILHTTYNFFGMVLFTLGVVNGRYDTFTVISTIVLALIVASHYLYLFIKIEPESIENLYLQEINN